MTTSDLRRQVGQLLIFGFDGAAVDDHLRKLLSETWPGGIILFARNIESPRQTWELLRDAQELVPVPLFRCVDLEGGTVDRLKKAIAPAPSVAKVVSLGDRKLFRRHGRVIGDECRAVGFNVDFAPVLDLAFPASQSVLGSRTVSPDPKETVAYARGFLAGLRQARVLGCGKHFPGLGEANLDTHFQQPAIDKPWAKLWREDLLPYRSLRRELPFVMVAHAAYPAVTKSKTPASLSRKWITDILRRKIGYRGLIVTDDLEMGGVLGAASIEEAAVETIRAGADIFLVCHNEDLVRRGYEAVLKAATDDRRFARRVRESAARAMAFKKKSAEVRQRFPAAPSEAVIARLRAALHRLRQEVERATLVADAGPGTLRD